jgi:hypothetical protein
VKLPFPGRQPNSCKNLASWAPTAKEGGDETVLRTQGKEDLVLTNFDREAATTIVVLKEQQKKEEQHE